MAKRILSISLEQGIAKESGRAYEYVSLKIDGTEINRIFIKQTEKTYFASLTGDYSKNE